MISGQLDAFSETSSIAGNALHFAKEGYNSTQIDLGLRAAYTQKTSFGSMSPNFSLEYHRLMQNGDPAGLSYADLTNGPKYLLTLPEYGSNQLRLGLGLNLKLQNGVTANFSSDTTFGSGSRSGTLRANIGLRF